MAFASSIARHLASLMLFSVIVACLTTIYPGNAAAQKPESSPNSCTLSGVIARYEAWRGGATFRVMRTIHERDSVETSGIQGSIESWSDSLGQVRVNADLGPMKQQQLVSQNGARETTPAGQLQSMSQVDSLKLKREFRMLMSGGLHNGDGETVSLSGCSSDQGRRVASLHVGFGDADTYDVSLDADSGEMLRIHSVIDRKESIATYGDWRMVDGVRFPFLTTTKDVSNNDTQTQKTLSLAVNDAVPVGVFSQLESRHLVTFANGARSTGWIDFDFVNGNRIFFPIKVDGQNTQALFDSGAEMSVIDTSFAKKINATTQGEFDMSGSGGTEKVGVASGVHVEMGALSMAGLTTPSTDTNQIAKGFGHDLSFILGDEILNETVADIDFVNHRIAFYDPTSLVVPKGAITIPLHRPAGLRSVPVSVENGPAQEFQFDIGNGAAPILIFPAHPQAQALQVNRKTSQVLTGGAGGMHPETVTTIPSVTFAGVTFRQVPASFSADTASAANSNQVLGNIGIEILSRFRLLIDYPHDRLYAVPTAGFADKPFFHDHLGYRSVLQNGVLDVQFVSPKSPAEAAGLKVGDQINAINGKPASDWTFAANHALAESDNPMPIEVTLANGTVLKINPALYY